MKIRTLLVCAAVCLAAQGFAPGGLQADEGEEVLVAHPMPVYPGSVPVDGRDKLVRLAKDDLGAVRKYFEGQLKPGDSIENFSEDGEAGFKVLYTKKLGARNQTVLEVRVAARSEKRPPHQAFGELFSQVSSGRHTRAELTALEKKYGDIDSAYFRRGGEGGEDKIILARAHKQAHPDEGKLKAAGRRNKVSDADKADAKEFKRKMKELKAQGDMAGMMALAQSKNKFQAPPAGQLEAAKLAAEDRDRDTWDLWVKCLEETAAAAYRTRLEYSSDALKN
ncbi:MAG: hypothetical protein NDI60_11615 [Elusimicrobiales bacterium]|nr:hypothetical protein [Elusimicrobiales bacterium]